MIETTSFFVSVACKGGNFLAAGKRLLGDDDEGMIPVAYLLYTCWVFDVPMEEDGPADLFQIIWLVCRKR
jgi:hypothetical protein